MHYDVYVYMYRATIPSIVHPSFSSFWSFVLYIVSPTDRILTRYSFEYESTPRPKQQFYYANLLIVV